MLNGLAVPGFFTIEKCVFSSKLCDDEIIICAFLKAAENLVPNEQFLLLTKARDIKRLYINVWIVTNT